MTYFAMTHVPIYLTNNLIKGFMNIIIHTVNYCCLKEKVFINSFKKKEKKS